MAPFYERSVQWIFTLTTLAKTLTAEIENNQHVVLHLKKNATKELTLESNSRTCLNCRDARFTSGVSKVEFVASELGVRDTGNLINESEIISRSLREDNVILTGALE